jgi:hypothetical protein
MWHTLSEQRAHISAAIVMRWFGAAPWPSQPGPSFLDLSSAKGGCAMKALCCSLGGSRGLVGALAVALALAAMPAQAATWYAANNGLDDNPCTKTAPCRSITKTMSVASEGDTIMAGPGLYGDLNRDGVVGNVAGEETPVTVAGKAAMIDVTKRLTIVSSDGAWATVLDANGCCHGAVLVEANGAIFGKANKGFTIRNKRATDFHGLVVADPAGSFQEAPNGVTVQGNVAMLNDFGFHLQGAGNAAKGNLAIDNLTGFHIIGTGNLVTANVAQRSTYNGFVVENASAASLTKNVAIDNDNYGFTVVLYPDYTAPFKTFGGNTAVGNASSGVFLQMYGTFSAPLSVGPIAGNNLFGNGASAGNCGLFVQNADTNNNSLAVTATGNFWGAPSGPGPDPADTAGTSDCISSVAGAVTVVTAPFATSQFKLAPPKIK